MRILRNLLPIIIVLIFSVFMVIPFLRSGFFPFHDNTQVQRVYEMTKALGGGMFPVRWSQDLGFNYGYPMFNFYAPLAYYIGSFFNILGLELLLSTKIMMVLGIILASFSMYLFSKEVFGRKAGVIASLLYVFAPFHAIDIYVRGDVAELWAYVFIPLVFYSIYKIYKSSNFLNIAFGSLVYAGLIVSHNLSALMVTPFILLFIIVLSFLKKNKKTIFYLSLPLVLGILISAFYWIPAILEMGYTNVFSQTLNGADFRDHFVCLNQLWSNPWGYGGSVKGCIDGMSFMIGKLHIVFFLVSVLIFALGIRLKKISKEKLLIFISAVLGLLISVFFTLDYSKFIWEIIKPMAFFQYPWRFLLLISFFISIIGASSIYFLEDIFKNIKNKWFILFTLLIAVLIVLFNLKFFVPQSYSLVSADYFTNDYFLKWETSNITSEYMPKNFLKPKAYSQIPKTVAIEKGKLNIESQNKTANQYLLSYFANSSSKILFPIAYFPAWQLKIDGQKTAYEIKNNGLSVNAPAGNHTILFYFEQTMIEKISDLITIAGILIVVIGIIYKKQLYEKSF